MSNFEKTCHLELEPEVTILQNGRRRVTRRFELGKNNNIDDVIYRAYGDADPGAVTSCTTGYANLKLIAQEVQPAQNKRASVLVQVFETLTGAWVAEIDDAENVEENGLRGITRRLVALPGTDFSGFVVGTATYGGLTLSGLQVERTDGFWRLVLGYGAAGVTSRSTTESSNGKLSTITIESRNEVPPTPSGYVLVGTQVVNEEGFGTTRYTFVRGEGKISEETQGRGDATTKQIRFLSAPSVSSNPITTPPEFLLLSVAMQEADGHRVWSASYGKGTDTTDFELNGLRRVTQIRINAVGTSTTGFVVGTTTLTVGSETLYLATFRSEENELFQRNTAVFLEAGKLSENKSSLNEGVVRRDYRFLGVEGTTVGTVLSRGIGDFQGLRTFDITTASNTDGNTLVGTAGAEKLAFQHQQLAGFVEPGVVDIEQTGSQFGTSLDPSLSAPAEYRVVATTYVFYQTTNTLVAGDFTKYGALGLWNPSSWARKVSAIAPYPDQDTGEVAPGFFNAQALRGYRVAEKVRVFGSGIGFLSCGVTHVLEPAVLDEVPGAFVNGRVTYEATIPFLRDNVIELIKAGGAKIIRSGLQVNGTLALRIRWTGTAWALEEKTDVVDYLSTSTGVSLVFFYRQATGLWTNDYVNQTSTGAYATVATATGDTQTPFTATWPAGVTVLPPLNEERYTLSGPEPFTLDGNFAAASFIEGRRLRRRATGYIFTGGGPQNPRGKRYTLSVDIKRALSDVDGTVIYQKSITIADIVPA